MNKPIRSLSAIAETPEGARLHLRGLAYDAIETYPNRRFDQVQFMQVQLRKEREAAGIKVDLPAMHRQLMTWSLHKYLEDAERDKREPPPKLNVVGDDKGGGDHARSEAQEDHVPAASSLSVVGDDGSGGDQSCHEGHDAFVPAAPLSEESQDHQPFESQQASVPRSSDADGREHPIVVQQKHVPPVRAPIFRPPPRYVRPPPGAGALNRRSIEAAREVEVKGWLDDYRIPEGPSLLTLRFRDAGPMIARMVKEGGERLHAAVILKASIQEVEKTGIPDPDALIGDHLTGLMRRRLEARLDPDVIRPLAAKWLAGTGDSVIATASEG